MKATAINPLPAQVLGVAVALMALGLAYAGFATQVARQPVQTSMAKLLDDPVGGAEAARNIEWATGGSLLAILDNDYGVKPPLYPVVLHIAYEAGIADLITVNKLLYLAVIALIAWIGYRCLPRSSRVALVLFAAAFTAFPAYFAPFRSESLFVAASLLTLLATNRYWEAPGYFNLGLLIVALGSACLTRYMGIFWLVPVTGLALLLIHRDCLRTGIMRATVVATASVLPCALYMLNQYRKTGFLTGIDRFETRFSYQDSMLQRFWYTVSDIPRVIASDFTTLRYQRFGPNTTESAVEYAAGAVIVGAILVGLWLFFATLQRRSRLSLPETDKGRIEFLVGGYLMSYLLVLIALWTVGNNDPINTRFVLPLYPLLLVIVASAGTDIATRGALPRLGAAGTVALAAAVQLQALV